jgi:adenylate cyclase
MAAVIDKSYMFAGFTLDLPRGCLRCADRDIELRPKSFAVLRYLIENPGRVVSRDEFMDAIWRDTIVTDESLTHCVGDVRSALGDGDQRIIKTVPRRGYVLLAPVTELTATLRSNGRRAPAIVEPGR